MATVRAVITDPAVAATSLASIAKKRARGPPAGASTAASHPSCTAVTAPRKGPYLRAFRGWPERCSHACAMRFANIVLLPPSMAIAVGLIVVAAAGGVGLTGCVTGCGVGAVPTNGDAGAASVSAAGVVTFRPIPVGSSEDFSVSVRDSADTDETILSAMLVGDGADAFTATAAFPLDVPAGQAVPIDVKFSPPSSGTFNAQLVLQTAKMGPSPVPLVGSSLDADAGADAG